MTYDGQDRRKNSYYCDGHQETKEAILLLKNNLEHLTAAVDRIDKHLEQSSKTRTNWWLTISSIIVGLLIQTFFFSYYLGSMGKQIEVNTKKIDEIEQRK